MQPQSTLMDGYAPRTITSSTDATPIEVTTGAHGYVSGDRITINGHTTNTNANGDWFVTVTSTTEFTLDDSTATGGGAGGADGCHCKTVGMALIEDYDNVVLSFDTDGGGDAAFTIKVVGSIQDTAPDFAAPQLPDNQYSYLALIDIDNSSNNATGSTGMVAASADKHLTYEININKEIRWLGLLPTAGTAGEVTVRMKGSQAS